MINDLNKLASRSTHNAVKRYEFMQRGFGSTNWSSAPRSSIYFDETDDYHDFLYFENAPELVLGSQVHGSHPIADEWKEMERKGFLQDPVDKTLRLKPRIVYPGVPLCPWLEKEEGIVPPPSMGLWIVIRYLLEPVVFPSLDSHPSITRWSGAILATDANLEWAPGLEHQSRWSEDQNFPSDDRTDPYMPPDNTLISHVLCGATDAERNFTLHDLTENIEVGQYFPRRGQMSA